MKQLFHMSRTAGVGMADYAAVNGFAVGSIVLGLASSLTAIFHEPFLLLLPALGLLLGLFAFFQVRSSNGTQTGSLVAIGGILFSLLFGGIVIVNGIKHKAEIARHKVVLGQLVSDFGADLTSEKFDDAYAKFNGAFQDRVKIDVFKARLAQVREGRYYGVKPLSARLEPRVAIEFDETTDQYAAVGLMTLEIEKPTNGADLHAQESVVFRLQRGEWKFEDVPNYFERQQQAPAQ